MTVVNIPEGYKLVPKDKMTAHMFDAVAINSEVGAFVAGNWSESFLCVNELYEVAVNAMPDAHIEVTDSVSKIVFEEKPRAPLPKIEGLREALENVCEPQKNVSLQCPECQKDIETHNGEWFLWCGDKSHADALINAARAYLEASKKDASR